MAPNIIGSTFILAETSIADANNNKMSSTTAAPAPVKQAPPPPAKKLTAAAATAPKPELAKAKAAPALDGFKVDIVWHNVVLFILLHSTALYGLFLVYAENAYLELMFGEFGLLYAWPEPALTLSLSLFQSTYLPLLAVWASRRVCIVCGRTSRTRPSCRCASF